MGGKVGGNNFLQFRIITYAQHGFNPYRISFLYRPQWPFSREIFRLIVFFHLPLLRDDGKEECTVYLAPVGKV